MKRNLSGEDAYLKMITATVPDKTDSYTPIAHQDILQHMRQEVKNAKFFIIGEDYKCTADTPSGAGGQVALGLMKIKFKEDPDLVLVATFVNSYNKQVAFRFALGAQVKLSGNTIMLESDIHGFYRRVHTGQADMLSVGTITELIQNAEEYWQVLVARKNALMALRLSNNQIHDILGELFIQRDLITTFQLNIVKKELTRLADQGINTHVGNLSGWHFYNAVAEGIKDTHPAEWMDVHTKAQDVFNELLQLSPAQLPGAQAEEDESAFTEWKVEDETGSLHYEGNIFQTAEAVLASAAPGTNTYLYGRSYDDAGTANEWELIDGTSRTDEEAEDDEDPAAAGVALSNLFATGSTSGVVASGGTGALPTTGFGGTTPNQPLANAA